MKETQSNRYTRWMIAMAAGMPCAVAQTIDDEKNRYADSWRRGALGLGEGARPLG